MRRGYAPLRAAARRAARREGGLLGRPRWCSSKTVLDIANEADLRANVPTTEEGNVLLASRQLEWKPLAPPKRALAVETSQLWACSNDPLEHTEADVSKFFQLADASSGSAFRELFYHTSFCGEAVEARARRLGVCAMMVTSEGLALRDELLGLASDEGGLAASDGILLHGALGVGKSMSLNYALACAHRAGWLVVAMPHAADWVLGLGSRSAEAAHEAYRVGDATYFSSPPPELEGSDLYESPDASYNFMLGLYLSQKDRLAQVVIKGGERIEHYASAALDQQLGPTLADMLRPVATDQTSAFADFPLPLRPMHDLLTELRTAVELPTLLAVDGYNRFDQMSSACGWRTKVPLHASQLLVPSTLGDMREYSSSMQRGLMLCATTSSVAPARVPMALRRRFPPPHQYSRPHTLPPGLRRTMRRVSPYSPRQVQAALELYGLVGHLANAGLEGQLRSGELATKVRLMTAGIPDDVFAICEQM